MQLEFLGLTRDAETAGPGIRLEYFTKGCIRGVVNPCQGCFNESSWTFGGIKKEMSVEEVVDHALECAWNRLVTFCGGEPMLQAKAITEVVKRLKKEDPRFHIVMYTAYKLDTLLKHGLKFTWVEGKHEPELKSFLVRHAVRCYHYTAADGKARCEATLLEASDVIALMEVVDMIVDGDYQLDKRLTTSEYMHKGWFIGSSNQRVFFTKEKSKEGDTAPYLYADQFNQAMQAEQPCLTCMAPTVNTPMVGQYCSIKCCAKHKQHEREMKAYEL